MKWPDVKFETLYAESSRNGLTRPKRVRGAGAKMVDMGELFANDRIGDIEMERVPASDSELERFGLLPGDLLFARQSLVASGAGQCALVSDVPEPTVFESHLIRVRLDETLASPGFYYYFFRSPHGTGRVQALVNQVAAAGIRGTDLRRVLVPIPPISTQRRIASILSAYDDLIENNTKRIKILEEMARALYREWFVHFRFPGHEKIDSPRGGTPDGWDTVALATATALVRRGVAPKYVEQPHEGELVLNQKCIREQRVSLEPARYHAKKVPDERYVQAGDVLINSTGVGTLGRVAQVLDELPRTTVDTHVTIVRPDQSVNPHYFGMMMLSMQPTWEAMGAGATGQTELSQKRVAGTEVILAPREHQDRFGVIVAPWRTLAQVLLRKNVILRQTRDLLLPRLISGDLDVSTLLLPAPPGP